LGFAILGPSIDSRWLRRLGLATMSVFFVRFSHELCLLPCATTTYHLSPLELVPSIAAVAWSAPIGVGLEKKVSRTEGQIARPYEAGP